MTPVDRLAAWIRDGQNPVPRKSSAQLRYEAGERAAATRYVHAHAIDADDEALLLSALGLGGAS